MTVQVQGSAYVLGLCKDFNISDGSGKEKKGVENRIREIAKADLRVSQPKGKEQLNISVWHFVSNPVLALIKSIAKSIRFAFSSSWQKRNEENVTKLYNQVRAELDRTERDGPLKADEKSVTVKDKASYTSSLVNLSRVLIAMGASNRVLKPANDAKEQLDASVKAMTDYVDGIDTQLSKDAKTPPTQKAIDSVLAKINELEADIKEKKAGTQAEIDKLPKDIPKLQEEAGKISESLNGLLGVADRTLETAKEKISQAALKPVTEAQAQLGALVEDMKAKNTALSQSREIDIERQAIEALSKKISDMALEIRGKIATLPAGIPEFQEAKAKIDPEVDRLLKQASEDKQSAMDAIKSYEDKKQEAEAIRKQEQEKAQKEELERARQKQVTEAKQLQDMVEALSQAYESYKAFHTCVTGFLTQPPLDKPALEDVGKEAAKIQRQIQHAKDTADLILQQSTDKDVRSAASLLLERADAYKNVVSLFTETARAMHEIRQHMVPPQAGKVSDAQIDDAEERYTVISGTLDNGLRIFREGVEKFRSDKKKIPTSQQLALSKWLETEERNSTDILRNLTMVKSKLSESAKKLDGKIVKKYEDAQAAADQSAELKEKLASRRQRSEQKQ